MGDNPEFKKEVCFEALRELRDNPPEDMRPQASSIRQFVFEAYDLIKELLDKGFTRHQIYVHLKNRSGVEFSEITFHNYLNAANKKHGQPPATRGRPAGKKAEALAKAIEKIPNQAKSNSPTFNPTDREDIYN